jgi:hypothetical protein
MAMARQERPTGHNRRRAPVIVPTGLGRRVEEAHHDGQE